MSTEYQEIRLARELALGEGTRPAGQPLCRIVLADGITLTEALTALRNPQHVTIVDPEESPNDEHKETANEPEKTEEKAEPVIPLAESPIPVEYHRPLVGAGLQSVQDVLAYRDSRPLTTIEGIGRKSAEAIESALK